MEEVRREMAPERVLVVIALGTLLGDDVRRLGFTAIERPVTIGNIVEATTDLLSRTDRNPPREPGP